jgi:hypothetical protein
VDTHFRIPAARFRPSFAFRAALKSEGAGNAGRAMRPQSGGPKKTGHTSVVTTVTSETPDIPRAMVLTGYHVLSPVTGLFATVDSGVSSASLTPAPGCQDHTPSSSVSAPFVKGASTSTASRPAFRDDREPPHLEGTG